MEFSDDVEDLLLHLFRTRKKHSAHIPLLSLRDSQASIQSLGFESDRAAAQLLT